ncbi:MAG: carbamoyltransferase [Parvularculaceae bacterium]|nr:carbamoyltransferase [Parvularculaceae bacterium]
MPPDSAAPFILGYSASHNGAACLLKGETIVAAIQEERLAGEKRARIQRADESLAIRYCLQAAGIEAKDLAMVVGAHFSGQALEGATFWPAGAPVRFECVPHHLAHAVGAFATSGFDEAAVLVIDGQGGYEEFLPESERRNIRRAGVPALKRFSEIVTIYRATGDGVDCVEKHVGDWIPEMERLTAEHGMQRFGSLGGMYAAAAHAIFGDAMDSGKVMGLSALGAPAHAVEELFRIRPDGGFDFFDGVVARYADNRRWPDHRDDYIGLAASVQRAVEVAVLELARRARALTGLKRLCYTGGVALNAVANEKLIRAKIFDEVFLQPAAEDSGPAIGAAYHGLALLTGTARGAPSVHDSAGRRYADSEVDAAIGRTPGIEVVHRGDTIDKAVELLVSGAIVGWFDGGSELGPRALGHRSLLCDPRPADAKEKMNLKVKHREPFRPFAPIIPEEKAAQWFDTPAHAPFSPVMLRVFPFKDEKAKSAVPAVVHYDGTGRLQTLRRASHPRLYTLVEAFAARTGVPIVLNTSFNVMGEPIIETPEDALFSLLYTAVDYCVFERTIVRRAPGFKHLLDLRPRLNLKSYRVETSFADGRAATQHIVEALTPWGPRRNGLHPASAAAIQRMDGRATGRDILKAIAPSTGLDERTMAALLHGLRRRYVISLS